jgi:hypothetical protein
MSMLSIIAASRRRASPLLAGLVEWWEDANPVGKHAGIILNTTNMSVVSGPPTTGLNAFNIDYYFEPNIPSTWGLNQPHAGPWTVAFVLLRTAAGQNRYPILDHNGTNINLTTTARFFRIRGGAIVNLSGSRTLTWDTYVLTYDGSMGAGYFNGAHYAITPGALVANWRSTMGYPDTVFATSVYSNRGWTQADVDEFHNSGNFVKYSDL